MAISATLATVVFNIGRFRGRFLIIVVTMVLAASASNAEQHNVVTRNDAIDDYVAVAELKELSHIRIRQQLHRQTITEKYVKTHPIQNTLEGN